MEPIGPAVAPPGPSPHQHSPGITITERWYTVGRRRFDVTELHNLRTVRGPHDPMTVRAACCAGAGLALFGLFFAVLPMNGRIGAVAAIIALTVIAALGAWRRPRGYELWAEYRGMQVQLFYSDSERTYGGVARALIRARERTWNAGIRDSSVIPHPAMLTPDTRAPLQNWFTRAA